LIDPIPLRGLRALVTGANGFIGAHLTRALIDAGATVTGIVRAHSDLWRLRGVESTLETVCLDLRSDGASELAAVEKPHVVFHLAAAGVDQRSAEPRDMIATNVASTLTLLQFAERSGVARFVYCGSCFEYGEALRASETDLPRPLTEYGATKAAGWLLAHAYGRRTGLDVVSLRPFTAYGPLEAPHRLIPNVIDRATHGDSIELTSGRQTRDFVYVSDVVEAFLRAASMPDIGGQTFNICSGIETSVGDVVRTILRLLGSSAVPVFGAHPDRRPEIWRLFGDPDNARARLGWTPSTPLERGLELTIAARRRPVPAFAAKELA